MGKVQTRYVATYSEPMLKLFQVHICMFNLALFYYTLSNIRPKYRSSLHTIQLIAVVTHPLLQEYGFECILEPFIKEINELRKVIKLT